MSVIFTSCCKDFTRMAKSRDIILNEVTGAISIHTSNPDVDIWIKYCPWCGKKFKYGKE